MNQRIVRSVNSADTNCRTTVYKCSCIFDDNYRIFFFIISQLSDSNEHHKLKLYGELTNYVFWLS